MTGDEELLAVFRAEAEEQIGLLAEALAASDEGWDLAALFRLAHSVKGAARLVDAQELAEAAHALEDLFSKLRDDAPQGPEAVALAREGSRLVEATFHDWGKAEHRQEIAAFRDKLGWWLEVENAAATITSPGPAPTREATPAGQGKEKGKGKGKGKERDKEPSAEDAGDSTLRIGVEKLEELTGLVAEMAVGEGSAAGLRDLARELVQELRELLRRQPSLAGQAEPLLATSRRLSGELERALARQKKLGAELGDVVRRLRMVSVGSLRTVLSRVVRDAAHLEGIKARLVVRGGETEIDRGLLAELRDPLVQLVRNAVAHGLEPAAERLAAGKAEEGEVCLVARAQGSWVEIEVQDDGRGLDAAALRREAVRRGLPAEEESAPEKIFELLFQPGFTTTAEANQLSGRGIGLDLVRSHVERLGGCIDLHTTVGRGASFLLRVPLTRLTLRVLRIGLEDQTFLIPVTQIERVFRVGRQNLGIADGHPVVDCEGMPVAVSDLRSFFGSADPSWEARPAVLLERRGQRRAFLVDAVFGELEAVLQPLPWNVASLPGISGLAIVDGERVLPILDPADLLERATPATFPTATAGTRRRRILVVDDSVTSRTLERNILAAAGYEVEVATNGAEAWEKLRAEAPDLLITDVDMPQLNGLDLTRKVRADRKLHLLPIILVTSLGQDEDREQGAEAGANAYVVKGAFDQDELLRAAARLL